MALAAPSAVSVTPNQGSGTSQRFTFAFSDSSGWTSLRQVNANINATGANANSCLVSYMPSNNYIYLLDDAGTAYLPGAPVGSSATLQNSQCSVDVQQSGSQGSGNNLTLYVALNFTTAYSGNKSIYMGAVDNSGANSGWRILGSWTVGGSGGDGGTCSAGPAPSVNICSPTSGSTVPSPVHVVATPSSNNGVIAMAVYVDNTLAYKQNVQTLDTNINMSNGNHYVVVQYWENSGNVPAKASVNITVGTTSGQPTATFSANPTTISTGGSSTLTWSTTNASSVSIDQGIGTVPASGSMIVSPATTTTYTLTATGSGATASATATVTVGSGGGGGACNPPSSPGAVICTPAPGSTVSSPVQFTGAGTGASGSVNHLELWIDGTKIGNYFSSTMSTSVSLATGSHSATLVEVDSTGSYIKSAPDNFTVGSGGGGGGGTPGKVDVLTMHNDLARDGANTQETVLTPSNVNPTHFGKIVGYGVDGQVYAQPLIVSNLGIGGGTHNVLYVATEHDSIYAFDADDATGTPYWSESLLAPGQSPASSSDTEGISPEIGVTGTPVIDRGNNTIYVVSMAYVSGGDNQFFLHALDLSTGHEKFGGPIRINPAVSGTGYGSVNGNLTIEGGCYQRVGLALANGIVYTTFGHCSHGWVVGYNENTLQLAGVYNSSPNGKGASIWMSGSAPPVDSSGNLYFETGVDADSTTNSGYSDAFIKLSPGLSLLDYFQVSNNAYLTANDADLGSGAPIIMPDNSSSFPHEVIGAGKDGRIFVVNRDNMGGFDPNANHVIQVVQSGVRQFDNFFDQPAYWNGYVYYHAEGDVLRQFRWSNGLLSTSPMYTGPDTFGTHGATPSVSANGTSNGIVWELQVDGQPNNPAILHAYDATDVSNELWNSSMNSGDAAGPAVKFTVPTIANGKVYVPAGNQVDIYGPK
jgi:hypothetical protein